MIALELLLLVILLILARPVGRLKLGSGCQRIIHAWNRIANRRWLAVWLVAVLAFVGSAAFSLINGFAEPLVHDEFSYLLGADTFAHGRWTNPTHPLWEHFETFHVLQKPSYQTKYPPGQSLMLAVGIKLGHPLYGVWLSMALCCGAICWMLQAWVPPRWALLGALLATLRLVLASSWPNPAIWSQAYWGGGVAAFGGALVFGAIRRIVPSGSMANSIVLGLGLIILANSRPYEGLIASLPCAVLLFGWMFSPSRPPLSSLVGKFLMPLGLVLALGVGLTGFYHDRVTGSPLRMPALEHQLQYDVAPKFYWQTVRPEPEYVVPQLRKIHVEWELKHLYGDADFGRNVLYGYRDLHFYFVGFHLWIPLLFLPFLVRDRWLSFALLTVLFTFLGMTFEIAILPHYAAPIAPLIFLLIIQAFRRMRICRRSTQYGRGLARMLPLIMIIECTILLTVGPRINPTIWKAQRDHDSPHFQRVRLMSKLEARGGKHLVVVHYGPDNDGFFEWVNNRADIDGSTIVWAHDLGTAKNQRLLDHFRDRTVWLLHADHKPIVLRQMQFTTETK